MEEKSISSNNVWGAWEGTCNASWLLHAHPGTYKLCLAPCHHLVTHLINFLFSFVFFHWSGFEIYPACIQKYVLGRPIEFSRTLMFVVAVKCWFCVLLLLLKVNKLRNLKNEQSIYIMDYGWILMYFLWTLNRICLMWMVIENMAFKRSVSL